MVIVQDGANLVKSELMHWKKRKKYTWLMTICSKNTTKQWLYRAGCLNMLNNYNWKSRHHLMFLFLQVFPFPDVLECCLVLLHIGSQCPPELREEALDLLRKDSSANIYKKAGRRFLTWHFETKLSPLSCLQLLNTKAVLSSSEGLFWWLCLFLIKLKK